MEPIATMDRANAQRIRDILDKALPEVLAPYGLSFQLGNARYDDDSVKFTGFNIAVAGGLTKMEKDLAERVEMSAEFGVELDADKVATYKGEGYALVGFKPRNHKYPYIWKKLSNGSNWKFDVKTTERFFGKDTDGESIATRGYSNPKIKGGVPKTGEVYLSMNTVSDYLDCVDPDNRLVRVVALVFRPKGELMVRCETVNGTSVGMFSADCLYDREVA